VKIDMIELIVAIFAGIVTIIAGCITIYNFIYKKRKKAIQQIVESDIDKPDVNIVNKIAKQQSSNVIT
jgi:hypothetical protein